VSLYMCVCVCVLAVGYRCVALATTSNHHHGPTYLAIRLCRLSPPEPESELEARISLLYHLRDEEMILDSMVSVCPAAGASVPKIDTTDSVVTMGSAIVDSCVGELDSTLPCPEADDRWIQLGAKPRAPPPAGSAPAQGVSWSAPHRAKYGGKHRSRASPPLVPQFTTNNKYSILDVHDFPPLTDHNIPTAHN